MNLASQGGDPNSSLLFVNFNQDCSSLAVGTKSGYKLFSLNSVDKLDLIYDNDSDDICIVERLFSSSLVAIVSLSSPRKLKVCHFKKGTEICNYSYSNTILAVRLNRLRLVVCLEESLYIHNIRDMKVLHTIRDTPPNPAGLCSLSVNNDNCFLAYPGSNQIGEVQIFDTVNLRAVTMIPAHDNPLAAMAFNSSGTRLATASEKGTVIRVFTVPDGQKLFEFRRGVKRCVTISSLAFSPDSLYLCSSSNTETVHIFKLECLKERPAEEPQGWMGYFNQALKSSATYLPSQVSDMLNQGRAFATARLPFCGLKNVCALAVVQKLPRLVVACQDGYLYIYNVDPVEGGECTLLKQHRLDGRQDTAPLTDPLAPAGSDKPLASPATGTGSYASTTRTGSDTQQASSSPGKRPLGPNVGHMSAGSWGVCSYATVVRRASGNVSEMTEEDDDEEERTDADTQEGGDAPPARLHGPHTDITDSWDLAESQAYQDVDHAAISGEEGTPNVEALRLDDDNEFPPMTHKSD